ncbi:NADPH-dependent ferric siderophore reductase [Microbacterium endophyticum]|uniref:NADPH-dependent ferric siderophore reductase n=1 Tax=Microbacterium endophyticum TaxID=1526412 RepID=A0A7W4V4F9_9MICO|nr:siderophore-interacting protein [Microbacterium endophyticum]MBB2976662.1 NADPH-dependent ferric siderophore reductase [Microbacterium endophyticum]NIK37623.1 NADPH-dependent ferric siderophore reductase [Microbacterium endophyticum]
MPTAPQLVTAEVARTVRLSPSFQRVTLRGGTLDDFEWGGFDHWFRLFIPPKVGMPLTLPPVNGRVWWKPYLAMPDELRPHYSNYTVSDVRRGENGSEMDIDVVLHWDHDGNLAGGVAIWAATAATGSPVGFLDQGLLFDRPEDATEVHVISDETGLPAIRGILRDLDASVTGTAIIEVAASGDVEQLAAPAGVEVIWIPRDAAHEVPGVRALAALAARPAPDAGAYAFIVGESSLATEGRRVLHRAGLPKSRITFSGFWKHSPVAS